MTQTHSERRRAGFTLAEVMFAVLILGIGLISIASLFPAASAAQKNTMLSITGEYVAANIEAKLKGRGISEATLKTYVPATSTVTKLNITQLTAIGLPLQERVFPEVFDQNRNGTANQAGEDNLFVGRQIYWEPLFWRDSKDNWKIYVFVMRRVGDTPPQPASGSAPANAGDWVLQGNGTLTRLTDDTTNGHFKGPVVDGVSTTLSVLTISGGVIR